MCSRRKNIARETLFPSFLLRSDFRPKRRGPFSGNGYPVTQSGFLLVHPTSFSFFPRLRDRREELSKSSDVREKTPAIVKGKKGVNEQSQFRVKNVSNMGYESCDVNMGSFFHLCALWATADLLNALPRVRQKKRQEKATHYANCRVDPSCAHSALLFPFPSEEKAGWDSPDARKVKLPFFPRSAMIARVFL